MKKTLIVAILIVAVIGSLMLAMKARAPKAPPQTAEQIWAQKGIPVETDVITVGNMENTVEITGDIKALDTVTLSAKIPGRVASITAREGDMVTCGKALVVLDSQDAMSNLISARGGLQSASARLSQAKTNVTVTKIQTDAAIEQAQAQLNAAKARLQVVKQPSRSQERMVSENAVAEAKANLDKTAADYKRNKNLLKQGAISQSAFDVAEMQYKVAQAQYKSASERFSMINEGGRSEEISQSEAQVQVAQEALRTAKANASQNMLRKEDLLQAKASLAQAKAAVALAQQQVSYCYVNSPISGVLSARQTEPGQVIAAGQSLGEIVNLSSIYFKGDVSEKDIVNARAGQNVRVKVDAIPGRTFAGRIDKIFPSASTTSRNFSVRVRISDPGHEIRPGMFARGEIVTGTSKNVLLIPKDAVDERKGTKSVFTIDKNNKAVRHIVTVLRENRKYTQIQTPTNLRDGDVVVTIGRQNMQSGSKVRVSNNK